jgi:hypothetical protein
MDAWTRPPAALCDALKNKGGRDVFVLMWETPLRLWVFSAAKYW